jgi:hypothetical protein
MNSTNNISARASYEYAKKMFYSAFRDKFNYETGDVDCMEFVNNLKLSQGEVRSEVQLTTTANRFVFGITNQQMSTGASALTNTETNQRLNLQDSLCVSEYAIFLAKPASATSTIFNLDTWGNPSTYTTSNVATAADGTFYSNGIFQLTCNNDVLIPARGLLNHRYVPQTQFRTFTAAATGDQVAAKDQQRGAEDAFVTCEPNIVLIGSKNYIPSIILPAALAAVESVQRAVIIFRGILAQNSTVIS